MHWAYSAVYFNSRNISLLESRNREICVKNFLIAVKFDSRLGNTVRMRPANERWRYMVSQSRIGWAHMLNDPSLKQTS